MVGEPVEPWLVSLSNHGGLAKEGLVFFLIFWTKPLPALPFCSLANSAEHAFASRAFQGAGFRLHCLAATACGGPSNPAYVTPRKIHPWIFSGLQNCVAILHALSRPPWLVIDWQVRAKKSIHGFSRDCRSASHFCMLLSRPPWLFTGWQVRAKNPSVDFLGVAELLRNSACAKPPSVARY